MTPVVWEQPPPARHGAVHDWNAIAATLKSRPGKWARIMVCATSNLAAVTARYVKTGFYDALQDGVYEAVSRTIDREHRVYARYVGPVEPTQ